MEKHDFKAEGWAEQILDPLLRLHTFLQKFEYPPCTWLLYTAFSKSLKWNQQSHLAVYCELSAESTSNPKFTMRKNRPSLTLNYVQTEHINCTWLSQQKVILLEVRTQEEKIYILYVCIKYIYLTTIRTTSERKNKNILRKRNTSTSFIGSFLIKSLLQDEHFRHQCKSIIIKIEWKGCSWKGMIISDCVRLDPGGNAVPSHSLKFGILVDGHKIPSKGCTHYKSYNNDTV